MTMSHRLFHAALVLCFALAPALSALNALNAQDPAYREGAGIVSSHTSGKQQV